MIRSLLEFLGALLPVAVLAGLLMMPGVFVFARFGDGPIGPFSGGPLLGEIEERPDSWGFAEEAGSLELQVGSGPGRSVRVGFVVHEGRLFVPALVAPVSRWRRVVEDDPHVVFRVEGRLFDGYASPVYDADWHQALFEDARDKYGALRFPDFSEDLTAFYRIGPPRV